jgi:hypothetical protein
MKTLATNYSRAPFFLEVSQFVEPLILNPERKLARYNVGAIIAIAQYLGLPASKFRQSSEMGVDEQSNEMLISLTRCAGGNTYLCGGGAAGYQDALVFANAGVNLIHQNFEHPIYPQLGGRPFVPGLSIIDALMNIGVIGVRAALKTAQDFPREV